MSIDPGTVAASVLDKHTLGRLPDLALDLRHGCEPLLVAHVCLPDDVVTGAGPAEPERDVFVLVKRDPGKGAAVGVELAPHPLLQTLGRGIQLH